MAYDSARGRVVLFGGWDGSLPTSTWEWNGTSWEEFATVNAPSGRTRHAMAFDSNRGVVVLFGGVGLDDTWEYDGTNWVERTPVTSPPARQHHAMVYDSNRKRIVLFGGVRSQPFNDTWEWDGINWVERITADRPPPMADHSMAYDSDRGVSVVFGGFYAETWEFNGNNWQRRYPSTSPPSRVYHSMAYDNIRKNTIIFGGDSGGFLDDTWLLDFIRLEVSPDQRYLIPGQISNFSLTIEGTPIFTSLSTSELPPDVFGDFRPTSLVTPTAHSTLILTTSRSTPDGLYPLTLNAGSSSVIVSFAVVTPDFGLIPSPPTWVINAGGSVTNQLFITATETLTLPIALNMDSLPLGVSGYIIPNPANPNSIVDVNLSAGITTTLGNYEIHISGVGSVLSDTGYVPITRTITVPLSVVPPDTATPTPTPTSTPTPSTTFTPTPSASPTSTPSASATPTPSATSTFIPTVTGSPELTPPTSITPPAPMDNGYLPFIRKAVLPTPTATIMPIPPTTTSTGTPVSPIPIGESVRFLSWYNDVPLEGIVTNSEFKHVLIPDYGNPVFADGVFVVILMDVTNHGLESGEVGRHSSFKVQDSVGRVFDMAELEVQWAAQDEYGRDGVYEAIQPGFTKPLVFAFDVLPESLGLHLVSMSPW